MREELVRRNYAESTVYTYLPRPDAHHGVSASLAATPPVHRLIPFDGERMTFRWKDHTHDGQWRTMTLTAMEFLRRFVQDVLPRGFVRIRQCGYLARLLADGRQVGEPPVASHQHHRARPPAPRGPQSDEGHHERGGAPAV